MAVLVEPHFSPEVHKQGDLTADSSFTDKTGEDWFGKPCDNKDTRVTEVLETMEASENACIGIDTSPPRKVARSIAQLKCIHNNAHSMGSN